MVDQVYRIGDLQDQAVAALRVACHATTAEALAHYLVLPLWAVEEGLKAAQLAGLAQVIGHVNGVAFWCAAESGTEVAGGAAPEPGLCADERVAVGNISLKG